MASLNPINGHLPNTLSDYLFQKDIIVDDRSMTRNDNVISTVASLHLKTIFDNLVFHDSISDRSVRSLSGILPLAAVCVNDLTMCPQSSKYWKYEITLSFKF